MCVFEFKAGYFVLFFSKVVSDSELDSPEFAAVNDKSSTRLFFFFGRFEDEIGCWGW